MQFIKPIPFQEAVDKLGARSVIGAALTSEEWSRIRAGLRDRAFWSATIENARFLQRRRDSIADFLQANREEITLPDGSKTTALKTGSRAQFIAQGQREAIAEGMGPLDPKHAGTVKDIRSERRLGLIFDTQVRMAQDFGNWKQGMDPDVLNAYPAQRFIRERKAKKTRDNHVLHEGDVRLKTDLAFWKALNRDFDNPYGPWGWGCGHDVEDVDRAEAERLGLIQPAETIQPVEKQFNDDLQASTRGLDPEMIDHLKSSFGDQVVIDQDSVKWKGDTHEQSRDGDRESGRLGDEISDFARRIGQAGQRLFREIRPENLGIAFDSADASAAGAQLAAVATARKPVWHEHLNTQAAAALAQRIAALEIPGIVVRAGAEGHVYAYHARAVLNVFKSSPRDYPGANMFDKIERATLSGTNGNLLGYGAASLTDPDTVLVKIFDPSGRMVFGFRSPRETARKFANARTLDFTQTYGLGYRYLIQ